MSNNISITEQALKEHESQSVVTTVAETEKKNIKLFCQLSLRKKQIIAEVAEERKKIRTKVTETKKDLLQFMQTNNVECMVLSKQDFLKLEEMCAEQGIPSIPLFARRLRNTKDGKITPVVVEEAIEAVGPEDISERNGMTLSDALQDAIMSRIKNIVREYTYSIRLVNSKPKTDHVYELFEAPSEMVEKMYELHRAQTAMAALDETSKQRMGTLGKELSTVKAPVQQFFERTGLMSQRITMDGVTFRLTRKVSVRHDKLSVSKVNTFVNELFQSMSTIKSLVDFESKSDTIKSNLLKMIQNVPPTTKSNIVFQTIRQQKETA